MCRAWHSMSRSICRRWHNFGEVWENLCRPRPWARALLQEVRMSEKRTPPPEGVKDQMDWGDPYQVQSHYNRAGAFMGGPSELLGAAGLLAIVERASELRRLKGVRQGSQTPMTATQCRSPYPLATGMPGIGPRAAPVEAAEVRQDRIGRGSAAASGYVAQQANKLRCKAARLSGALRGRLSGWLFRLSIRLMPRRTGR